MFWNYYREVYRLSESAEMNFYDAEATFYSKRNNDHFVFDLERKDIRFVGNEETRDLSVYSSDDIAFLDEILESW